MRHIPIRPLGWLLLNLLLTGQALSDELEAAKTAFDQRTQILNQEQDTALSALHERYLGALDRLRKEEMQRGDLDQVLLIEEEKTWVSEGAEPMVLPPETGHGLKRLRATYQSTRSTLDQDRLAKQKKLTNTYVSYLETVQRERVRMNDIEGAMACREEVRRVLALIAPEPTPEPPSVEDPFAVPGDPFAAVETTQPFALRWSPQFDGEQVSGSDGSSPVNYTMNMEGGVALTNDSLRLNKEARVRIPEAGERFSEACSTSGEFTLFIRFSCERKGQSGPARILSLSEGTQSRNLTLGQQHGNLILRLRTTETDPNGTTPEIPLGKLEKNETTTVVITYSSEQGLSGFRDGHPLELPPLKGSLENWTPMTLLLGNEQGESRPWLGEIYGFELQSNVLESEEALLRSQNP